MKKTILFDLDGTLIESAHGISLCLNHALSEMKMPNIPDGEIRQWIGPPLQQSFGKLFKKTSEIDRAIKIYLDCFNKNGWYRHKTFPGIESTILEMHKRGHRLAVVTSKYEDQAERIVGELSFGQCFEIIVGATYDNNINDKTKIISEALIRLKLNPSDCLMIGDRDFDIVGAKANDVSSIGVSWGYGTRKELHAAAPMAVVDNPHELIHFLCT